MQFQGPYSQNILNYVNWDEVVDQILWFTSSSVRNG